jgi:putative solute:sodium symporter small subunit
MVPRWFFSGIGTGTAIATRLPDHRFARACHQKGIGQVRDASETTWWRRTRQFAAATVAGTAFLALILLRLAGPLDGHLFFGLPFGTFLAAIVAPAVVLVVVIVFATQQQALDRRYDVAED